MNAANASLADLVQSAADWIFMPWVIVVLLGTGVFLTLRTAAVQVRRFGDAWPVLLSHLILFGFIYPGERGRVPRSCPGSRRFDARAGPRHGTARRPGARGVQRRPDRWRRSGRPRGRAADPASRAAARQRASAPSHAAP